MVRIDPNLPPAQEAIPATTHPAMTGVGVTTQDLDGLMGNSHHRESFPRFKIPEAEGTIVPGTHEPGGQLESR